MVASAAGPSLAWSFYRNDDDLTRGFARRVLAATRHLPRAITKWEGLDGIALNRVIRRMPAYLFGPAARWASSAM